MSSEIPYWEIRTPIRKSFRAFLKNDVIVSRLFNLRAGSEGFLKRKIESIRERNSIQIAKVLDIACGWGVSFATSEKVEFYGVDIEGFPREVTLGNGYKDAREYGDDLSIPYEDQSFDVVTILNLNAHVSNDLYSKLLSQARRKLKPDGVVLIVAELNNRGWSYNLMRRLDHRRFDKMVAGMDHSNFVFEKDFDSFLAGAGLETVSKSTIIGNILPFFHYTSWAIDKSPYETLRIPAFAADAVNSLVDGTLTALGLSGAGRRFNVGYVCRFRD